MRQSHNEVTRHFFSTEAAAYAFASRFLAPGGGRPVAGYKEVTVIFPDDAGDYVVELTRLVSRRVRKKVV
jgi:hypothetical protein